MGSACFNIPMSAILDVARLRDHVVDFVLWRQPARCHFGFSVFVIMGRSRYYRLTETGSVADYDSDIFNLTEDVDDFLALIREDGAGSASNGGLSGGQKVKMRLICRNYSGGISRSNEYKSRLKSGAATAKTTGFNQPVSFSGPYSIVLVAANIALLAAVYLSNSSGTDTARKFRRIGI